MKLKFPDIKTLIRPDLIWFLLNIFLNIFGLLISKISSEATYVYLDSIFREFTRPLFYQLLIFLIVTLASYTFANKFKWKDYIFPLTVFVILNIFFFSGVKFHGGLHFESTFNSLAVKSMGNLGQYLVDCFYLIYPMPGIFDDGVFKPANTGMFYLHWVLLNSAYYFILSWLTKITDTFFFGKHSIEEQPATDI